MRTVNFRSVLDSLCHKVGLAPAEAQQNLLDALANFLSLSIGRAWEMDAWWPWVLEATKTYDPAYAPDPYIAIEADMGNIIAVLDDTGNEYEFLLRGGYIIVASPSPAVPTLVWTQQAPEFTATTYATGTTYAAGSLVLAPDGDCYRATASTSQQPPGGDWTKQEFPHILRHFAIQDAYAESLETDGQTERAALARQLAKQYLDDELDKIFMQQSQKRRFKTIR